MTAYTLTKIDIAALKQADYLSVSIVGGISRVRATKRQEKTEKDPFAQDVDHSLETPVTAYATIPDGSRFSALVYLYQDSAPTSVMGLLKAGDEVSFRFCADFHTNQYLERAELHGDVLQLIVTRGKQRMCFEIAHSTCPDNSARMCRGATRKEYSLA